MANRHTLHRRDAAAFAEWLQADEWSLGEPKGPYEAIRAQKGSRTAVFYDRNEGEHLSFEDKHAGVVNAFIRDKKKAKREAEKLSWGEKRLTRSR